MSTTARQLATAAMAASLFAFAAPARANANAGFGTTVDRPSTATEVRETRQPWFIETDLGSTYVNESGMQYLGGARSLVTVGLRAGREILAFDRAQRFVLAVGGEGAIGTLGGSVRGSGSTSLTSARLAGFAEARWRMAPFAYLYARVAPGMQSVDFTLHDASNPVAMSTTQWRPAIGGSVGGVVRLGRGAPSWWLGAEIGYLWADAARLSLSPDVPSNDPRAFGGLDLGDLALRGIVERVWVGVSF
jgi:hypothetical protein